MKFGRSVVGAGIVAAAAWVAAGGPAVGTVTRVSFDGGPFGSPPAGWMVAATHGGDELASWRVTRDPAAPSPPGVLRVLPPAGASGSLFNLCWTEGIRFGDGEIEVKLRADRGREDQGGGPMWRVVDRNNYYVARYNPLEHNFRVYVVRKGHRKMLGGASGIRIGAGRWCTIRIAVSGDHIQGWLDGTKRFDVHDATFPEPGGVGLWTKADAASSFDDLVVRPAAE